MDFLDDETLLTRLPRRSDDEPANLRQDLLDEVRDYLQSAWEEELKQTPDSQQAWREVLQRFGDPAKLVRKLWFDALKEQIMSRRMVLAAFGVVAVMFVAFAAINLRMLSALETTLAEAQKTNALLVEKLEALSGRRAEPEPVLRHIRMQLVGEGGASVAGRVTLWGSPFGAESAREPYMTESGQIVERGKMVLPIDVSGRVDFGPIHAGNYDADIELDNGLSTRIYNISLLSDADAEREFRCPAPSQSQVQVKLKWTPPLGANDTSGKTAEDSPLWLLCQLQEVGRRGAGTMIWRDASVDDRHRLLLLSPTGEAYQVDWDFNDDEELDGAWLVKVRGVTTDMMIVGLTEKVWDGRLSRDSLYEVTSTELVRLKSHSPDFSKWHFECLEAVESELPDVGSADACSPRGCQFRFAAWTRFPADPPVQIKVSLSPESVDGVLRLRRLMTLAQAQQYLTPRPGGMGGGLF